MGQTKDFVMSTATKIPRSWRVVWRDSAGKPWMTIVDDKTSSEEVAAYITSSWPGSTVLKVERYQQESAKDFLKGLAKERLDLADYLESNTIPEVAMYGNACTWGFRKAIRLLRNSPGTGKNELREFNDMLSGCIYALRHAGLETQVDDLKKAAALLCRPQAPKMESAKDFIKGLSRELNWNPVFQSIRGKDGLTFRWRYDVPDRHIVMFLDREGPGLYSVQFMDHHRNIGMRTLKDEEGRYTWSAVSIYNAEDKAKDLVQRAVMGKFYEAQSPKEFFKTLPLEHEIERLRLFYVRAGFDRTAQRLLAVKFMLRNPIPKGWAPTAMLDNWIAELEPYEHRPGHENGQRLLSVLRRANRQLSGIKEGKAKDFIKKLAVYEPWLHKFYRGYVDAALWSSMDDNGTPLDQVDAELSDRAKQEMSADCRQFYAQNREDIETGDPERAGHDFWLTRNGHGAGFWDGDWEHEVGKRLTDASDAFGSVDLYIGADGLIHQA